MHDFIASALVAERNHDLAEHASRRRRRAPRGAAVRHAIDDRAAVTIRYAGHGDAAALNDLATLDDRSGRVARRRVARRPVAPSAPAGGVLVAEEAGRVVAALPLDGSPAYADPFRPTAPLLALLEARAEQLARPAPARPRRVALRLGAVR